MTRMIDLRGLKFGRLTVVDRSERQPDGETKWVCQCDCGGTSLRRATELHRRRGGPLGCAGCVRHPTAPIDLVGRRFGHLVVIGRAPVTWPGRERTGWLCRCDCGGQIVRRASHLKRHTAGCETCLPERRSAQKRTHGGSINRDGSRPRLYSIWSGMKLRCHNPTDKGYGLYGGRGIKVCADWQQYQGFRDWALANGYAEGLSIDRIDTWKGYEPSNCRWVTLAENARTSGRIPPGWRSTFPPSVPIEMLMGFC